MALTKAAKEEAYGGVEFIVVDGCGNGGGERSGYGRAKQGYDSCEQASTNGSHETTVLHSSSRRRKRLTNNYLRPNAIEQKLLNPLPKDPKNPVQETNPNYEREESNVVEENVLFVPHHIKGKDASRETKTQRQLIPRLKNIYYIFRPST
ncbi:hypothetical protein YC2023_050650 [Brassica napus]